MPGMTWMIAIAATGAALSLAGLVYGVLMVGVPYPDPTPAQDAAEKSNLAISSLMMAGGGTILMHALGGHQWRNCSSRCRPEVIAFRQFVR
jgi:hypothetical protein